MTDFTIRPIRDLRELTDPPASYPERSAEEKQAEREAALADALALLAKLHKEH